MNPTRLKKKRKFQIMFQKKYLNQSRIRQKSKLRNKL